MKKLKFPEDFFAYENPDCPDKDIEKAVNRMKNWMKGETYKSNASMSNSAYYSFGEDGVLSPYDEKDGRQEIISRWNSRYRED